MLDKILKYNSRSTSAQLYGYSLEHYGLNLPELMQSQYEILGVVPGATKYEINKAYKQLALMYHPDRLRHSGENDVELKSKNESFSGNTGSVRGPQDQHLVIIPISKR